jgi:hypothetical protein
VPAQKISLGHHACLGGNGACDGKVCVGGDVGSGTAVEMVIVGTSEGIETEPGEVAVP